MVRAEMGKIYFKSKNGDFEVYQGLVPENVFGKLRERLLVLEAMFLKVPSILDRKEDAMLNALLHVFAGCQTNQGKKDC